MGIDNFFETATLELPTSLCEAIEQAARERGLSVAHFLLTLLNESLLCQATTDAGFQELLAQSVAANQVILDKLPQA